MILHRRDQRHEGGVEEEELVLGVIDDVDQLLGREPRVDRVAHGPDAGDRVIELEMAVAVPGEGRDPVAKLHPLRLQPVGKLAGPFHGVRIGVAVHVSLGADRDDLALRILLCAEFQNLADQQRTLHHHALHGSPPVFFLAIC